MNCEVDFRSILFAKSYFFCDVKTFLKMLYFKFYFLENKDALYNNFTRFLTRKSAEYLTDYSAEYTAEYSFRRIIKFELFGIRPKAE